jgi:hypothetical protein
MSVAGHERPPEARLVPKSFLTGADIELGRSVPKDTITVLDKVAVSLASGEASYVTGAVIRSTAACTPEQADSNRIMPPRPDCEIGVLQHIW